jgi:tetratricopeptide (TPR) repeat protein
MQTLSRGRPFVAGFLRLGCLALAALLSACGVDTAFSPTLPPSPPTVSATAVALPSALPSPSAIPTAAAGLPTWLMQTWKLKTYRLHLRVDVTVKRPDGRVDEGVIIDFAGAFHQRDADYQQIDSTADQTGRMGYGGTLRVIKAAGRTYVRGPSSRLSLDSPAWYQIEPSLLSSAGRVYDVHTTLPGLFGPLNLRNLAPAGTETLDGQRCDLMRADEDAAPHMVEALASLPSKLKTDQPVRQQLQAQRSTLTNSEATIWVCSDGYLHRVEARYGYQTSRASDGEITWTLKLDLLGINDPVSIAAPSDAITPHAHATPVPSADQLSATDIATAAELVRRGEAQIDAGDYRAAIASLTQALSHNPRAADAYFARGEAYVLLERYAHAIDDYTHALALAPDFGDAFRRRGFARRKSEDICGAIKDYSEAIRLNADDHVAYLGRGLAYGEGLDDWQRAADDYTHALAIDPNYTSAYHNRGVARQNMGDYTGAVADYTEEIKREPDDASAYRGRGLSYLRLQSYQNAIDDLDIAIDLDPSDASAFCNRGAAYLGMRDHAAAVRDSSESIRLNPDDTCAYVNRGETRAAQGDTPGALEDYQRALDLSQHCGCQDELVKLLRERIEQLQP